MYRVKGHRETNSSFIFIKLLTYGLKSHFQDKDYSNTFILPIKNPNMFKYCGTNQGTTNDISKLLISQTCKHRGQNLNFRVKGHFILPNLKQNMFKYQVSHQRTSRDKFNLFIKLVTI